MKKSNRIPFAVVWPIFAIVVAAISSRIPPNFFAHLSAAANTEVASGPGEIVAPVTVTPYTTHLYIQLLRDDLRTVRLRKAGSAMAVRSYNQIAAQVDPNLLRLNHLPQRIVVLTSPSRKQ